MLTFLQYIQESGRPGRGGEGWGAASNRSRDAYLDFEKEKREEALARRAKEEEERRKQAAREQAKRAKEDERLRNQLNQYGFWDFNKNKGNS